MIPAEVVDLLLRIEANPANERTLVDAFVAKHQNLAELITNYKGRFTLKQTRQVEENAQKVDVQNYNVFHPMSIIMVDGNATSDYTQDGIINLLTRNGRLAAEDQLYRNLIDDLDGSLMDFVEQQIFRGEATAKDIEILRRFKFQFQNQRGLEHDPNLGGVQSGVQGIIAAKNRLIALLNQFVGSRTSSLRPKRFLAIVE